MNKQSRFLCPETENKINALLVEMTLDEKIGQLHQVGPSPVGGFDISLEEKKQMLEDGRLSQEEYDRALSGVCWDNQEEDIRKGKIGAFLGVIGAEKSNHLQRVAVEESRLGIPLLMGLDVIHGQRTIFPIPLAESCAWDDKLWEFTAAIAAKEAAANGIHWTFAPMVDIARDARWGRIAEGAGEDPYLASRFAASKVGGFQGNDLSDPSHILACAKHFAAYGAGIGGRDYNTVDMSPQTLAEIYLPPFRAAAETGVATYMAAFNDWNGVPCTINRYLLHDVLRKDFGFEGFVVSDANAIAECIDHGAAKSRSDAARQAINAGMEMDMVSRCFTDYLPKLVESGQVSIEQIDEAVRHILRIKFAKGLFEHPYTDPSKESSVLLCKEHRAAARDTACRSAVLLKNDAVLPLFKGARLLVVGELASNAAEMLGTWTLQGRAEETVTLVDGLIAAGMQVTYLPCCGVYSVLDTAGLAEAAAGADVILAAVGEIADRSGEASSMAYIGLPGDQPALLKALQAFGKPVVAVLFNGRPLAIPDVIESCQAVVEAWHPGTEAGNALTDILLGLYNPSGRLTTTFPNNSGECPLYYNHPSTGRPCSESRFSSKYLDTPIRPLFPFGYGLSYTEYAYDQLRVRIENAAIAATVEVKNAGRYAGEETVQLYIRDMVGSRVRPVKELKAFAKVWLEPQETKTVSLSVPFSQLGFYDTRMQFIVEPGDFQVQVGHDSETGLKTIVEIAEDDFVY